jgi:hypothetical protein
MPLSTNHPILKYGTSRMKKLKHGTPIQVLVALTCQRTILLLQVDFIAA